MIRNSNKVAIITGANGGIGKAITDELLSHDYNIIAGMRSGGLEQKDLFNQGDNIHKVHYDAKIKNSGKNLVFEAMSKYGQINAVINCAGILKYSQIEDKSEDSLDEMMEVNFKGPLRLINAAFPELKKNGEGRIINIVSLSGKRVQSSRPLGYFASKFALMALTNTAKYAGWDDGIRVTAICPGWVNTDMVKDFNTPEPEEMTQPEDLAKIIHTILELPNNASISELSINCLLESS